MEQTPDEQTDRPSAGGAQLLLVGGLLVIIIGALATLWLMERKRRNLAEEQLQQMDLDVVNARLLEMLKSPGLGSAAGQVGRDEAPREAMVINGRERKVFRLRADQALRFDARPGDVIVISAPQPTTAPGWTPTSGPVREDTPRRTEAK